MNIRFLAISALVLVSGAAEAANLTCKPRDVEDATIVVRAFGVRAQEIAVNLFVPNGETSGRSLWTVCRREPGYEKLEYNCEFMTSTDSGYSVKLLSTGTSTWIQAQVSSWTMAGITPMGTLPCPYDQSE